MLKEKRQRLKAIVYLKNNKRRAAILFVSFGLLFGLLYGVCFLIVPSTYTDEVLCVRSAEEMQVGYINQYGNVCKTLDLSLWEPETEGTVEEKTREINRAGKVFLEELRGKLSEGKVYLCNSTSITITTFIGNSYFYSPMLSKQELYEMVAYLGLELSAGRMPEQPGEILVDERMLKNLSLTIGDTISNKQTKIVGTVKYDCYFAAGIDYEEEIYTDRHIYLVNHGAVSDLKEFFREFGIEADTGTFSEIQIISDRVNAVKTVDRLEDELSQPVNIITYTILIVLSITLFFVYRLHVIDRYSEWCLYRSLGFSAKEVYFLAFREYGICLLFGIFIAALMTVIVFIIGGALMIEKGIFFRYFLPEQLLQIAAIIVFLTGVLQIPVVSAMKKVKTIDAIEQD